MIISSLKLTNFRTYKKIDLNFSKSLNIIFGNNGVGKTNLVESIYTLSLTKSFRTSSELDLISRGELSTKIEGVVGNNDENTYRLIINKEGKKAKINNTLISKISDYITNIKVILLKPDEHMIFSSNPQERRKLLNIEISKLEKDYIVYLNNYNKLLKQRNSYLKEMATHGNKNFDYLSILTKKMVEYGIIIHKYRENFIKKINEYIGECYKNIFENGNLKIKYISNYNNKTKEEIIEIYEKHYQKEIIFGKTQLGIHHDDIIFLLNDENISKWGSNGEQKNAIFSFKLAEIKMIYEKTLEYPILILDDLFSALDNQKVKIIVNLLKDNIQTFITTTDLDKIDETLINNAKIFKVLNGSVEEV